MKVLAKALRTGARFTCFGFLAVQVSGCMQMMILGKGLQNAASTTPEERQRYEERKIQASTLFKARCLGEAMEQIDRPLEGILVLKLIDIPALGQRSHNYGFYRLGLTSLEVETDSFGRSSANGFTYYDLTSRTYNIREKSNANATVVFENIGNVEEKNLGIYGRRIKVIDNLTNEVVATRTEFFGPGPTCPSAPKASADGYLFLSRTINPVSYGCWYKTEHIESWNGKSLAAIEACELAYWESHGKPAR